MTLEELHELLGEMLEQHPYAAEALVMLATQPNWPMEQEIAEPVLLEHHDEDEPQRKTVYIPVNENASNDYLHGAAAEAIGWRS